MLAVTLQRSGGWQALAGVHSGAGIMHSGLSRPFLAALQWRIPNFSSSAHLRLYSDQFEVCSKPW